MAKYTTELRSICEVYAGYRDSQGYADVSDVIEKSRARIFDFDFPIFDDEYRATLETKIIEHFYTREICCETVGRWKLFLRERMNLIMPYYNKLYASELLEFNPFYDVDITRDHKRDGSGDNDSTTESSNSSSGTSTDDYKRSLTTSSDDWSYYSDTPQGGITGLEDKSYMTTAQNQTSSTEDGGSDHRENESSATNTGTNKATATYTDTEEYLEHVKGKQGTQSYASMLKEYRETFMNIDALIMGELSDLFIDLW